MDIILEFYIRNHSGIDLHDTDIDFFRPIIFKKRTAPLTYYTSTKTNAFCLGIILCNVSRSFDYLIYPYYPAYTS